MSGVACALFLIGALKEAPRANLPPAYGYDVYPRCPPGVAQMKVHRVLYRIPRFKI